MKPWTNPEDDIAAFNFGFGINMLGTFYLSGQNKSRSDHELVLGILVEQSENHADRGLCDLATRALAEALRRRMTK